MQLDQNLFKKDSRGNAIIPLQGSRNGAKGQDIDGGYGINTIKLIYKKGRRSTEINTTYSIVDTRMKVNLPKALEANGGIVGIKIDFSFTSFFSNIIFNRIHSIILYLGFLSIFLFFSKYSSFNSLFCITRP